MKILPYKPKQAICHKQTCQEEMLKKLLWAKNAIYKFRFISEKNIGNPVRYMYVYMWVYPLRKLISSDISNNEHI
jgi:hypothetical protein